MQAFPKKLDLSQCKEPLLNVILYFGSTKKGNPHLLLNEQRNCLELVIEGMEENLSHIFPDQELLKQLLLLTEDVILNMGNEEDKLFAAKMNPLKYPR
jgi:hypothetical protein